MFFIICFELTDNTEVKNKIQHEKEKSICLPTRKESINHNIQTPSMGKLRCDKESSRQNVCPRRGQKHSKPEEQVRTEHTGKTSSISEKKGNKTNSNEKQILSHFIRAQSYIAWHIASSICFLLRQECRVKKKGSCTR